MPRSSSLPALSLLVVSVAAHAAPDKKDKAQGRLLYGKVLDRQDNPCRSHRLPHQQSNPRGQDLYRQTGGTYRFPGLSSVDYEVYAQCNGHKSDTKSVSQFDDRPEVYIDLKIDAK